MSFEVRGYGPEFGSLHTLQGYRQADEPLGEARALLAWRGGRPLARLSLQAAGELRGLNEPAGLIGHYECLEPEAGVFLLGQACAELKDMGARLVLGPMNGSTWQRYRLVLPGGTSPVFLGEPENPPSYAAQFEAAGFKVRELYESREVGLTEHLPWDSYLPERVRRRYGSRVRPIDLGAYALELQRLYDEASEAFDAQMLFSPISREDFVALYMPLKDFYDPDFVRLYCDENGKVLGHVTAYPDGDRVILKSLACRKELRGLGLAHLLSYQVHELAFKRGYKSVVHALMHVENRSDQMSAELGTVIRSYALYGRGL